MEFKWKEPFSQSVYSFLTQKVYSILNVLAFRGRHGKTLYSLTLLIVQTHDFCRFVSPLFNDRVIYMKMSLNFKCSSSFTKCN